MSVANAIALDEAAFPTEDFAADEAVAPAPPAEAPPAADADDDDDLSDDDSDAGRRRRRANADDDDDDAEDAEVPAGMADIEAAVSDPVAAAQIDPAVVEADLQAGTGNDEDATAGAGGDGAVADAEREDSVEAEHAAPGRIPTFKKKSDAAKVSDTGAAEKADDDDDDSDDILSDEEEQRRRKKRRSKKRERRERDQDDEDEQNDEPVMDAAARRKMELEERMDNIGKKPKVQRRKKKGGEDVDIVDTYHDEVCARLRDRMIAAADKDEAANRSKMPATSKLAMLDEVVGVLQNTTLWQSIVDNGVLEAVKRWLEPLPDRSLPAVGIQKAIFEVLPKMDVDTTTLKECRLGPVVLFYTKTKRAPPAISRQADALVQAWSRPIIKRPADFRSRQIVNAQELDDGEPVQDTYGDDDDEPGQSQGQSQSRGPKRPKRFDVAAALKENVGRKGARPLIAKDVQYTVAPQSRQQHRDDDIQHVSRLQNDNKKFNRFARQLKMGRR